MTVEEYNAKRKAERDARLKKVRERYEKLYPEAQISDFFIFEIDKREREEEPCKNCNGYPCKKNIAEGFRFVVQKNIASSLTYAYAHCKHAIAYREQMRLKKFFRQSKIPMMYLGKTFDDYLIDSENKAAVSWSKYVIDNETEGLYIFGEPGSGKTFLVAIVAQAFLQAGKTVMFGDVPSLLDDLRSTFDRDERRKNVMEAAEDLKPPKTLTEMVEQLSTVDMLILDDLGVESPTEWAVERLYMIINNRYTEGKPIIVTSNYDLRQVAERLNRPKNSAEGVTGNRIVSRIKQMCRVVELKGTDRRLRKK